MVYSLIDGYVKNLLTVSSGHDKKRKYFQLALQSMDEEIRCASFLPKKYKLLSKTQNNDTGCELKFLGYNDKEKLIIGG